MVLTKISRSKSFEMVNGYGLKTWDKYGLEAEISPNEDPIELYKELDKMILEAHKEANPLQSLQVMENQKEIQVDKPKQNSLDSMVQAITTCTEVATLMTFEKLSKSKPEFEKAYHETMIKLTNKTD